MKISIACDGSIHSHNALHYALRLPFKKAEYTLVHVVSPILYDPEFVSDESQKKIESFNQSLHKQGQKILDEGAEHLTNAGVRAAKTLLTGYPSDCLAKFSHESDLIIMGARGVNPIQSLFLGSVCDHLVRYAPCPVLVCRSETKSSDSKPIDSVVTGIDGSNMSSKIVEFFNRFDPTILKDIQLVSALKRNFYFGVSYSEEESNLWDDHKADIHRQLKQSKEKFQSILPESQIRTKILDQVSDISEALIRYCKDHQAGLLVTGSHGKDFLDRILLGSVSWKLAHHSELPLLIIR